MVTKPFTLSTCSRVFYLVTIPTTTLPDAQNSCRRDPRRPAGCRRGLPLPEGVVADGGSLAGNFKEHSRISEAIPSETGVPDEP
ncbi:hypothetical protein E2C01_035826 [Portunus trituberculatus]|uniref:Uncharacterized protein n=1 Tax=Portunus trituberculatus TaxID=210409 RepID=A0A5B7F470_PORTR|nr:hypothetical protein [Portunus trituberculatus]